MIIKQSLLQQVENMFDAMEAKLGFCNHATIVLIVLEFAKPIRMKQEEQCIKIRLKKIWKTANKKDNHDVLRLNNKMTNIRK